ncbi:hypothetical protein T261_2901 [Streptomyces lydicus]|nr:hypothetical protein T261_2901 [Streptomyces lydicus]
MVTAGAAVTGAGIIAVRRRERRHGLRRMPPPSPTGAPAGPVPLL